MLEIKFRGRGGQGAVVACRMLGKAFFIEGKWPQAFSLFGSERRGAPVFGFLRVDDKPIYLKCQIRRPDHLVIFDLTAAEEQEALDELKPGGLVLINTRLEVGALKQWRRFRIGLVDASAIAAGVGLAYNFNTAMLGAYAGFTGLVKLDTLVEAVRSIAPSKIEANLEAVRRGYHEVKSYEVQESG